jgi:hypothetical protein
MNHLTDKELIDYVLKHDTDPVRVRLAGVMERMPGVILDGLVDVGMDDTWCTFENTWHPGDYIHHLRNEIEFYERELMEAQEKLQALEKRTLLEFMVEIGNTVQTLENKLSNAEAEAKEAKSKLSMWNKLNGVGL